MTHNYACKECLLKGNCSELCEDIMKDAFDNKMLNFIIENKCCPDCGDTILLGCGGESLKDNRVFIDSSAICIECGSLYFTHESIIGRFRKHRKDITDTSKVRTFWRYLLDNHFISDEEYNNGEISM